MWLLWRCPPGAECATLSAQSRFGAWCCSRRSGESPVRSFFNCLFSRQRATQPGFDPLDSAMTDLRRFGMGRHYALREHFAEGGIAFACSRSAECPSARTAAAGEPGAGPSALPHRDSDDHRTRSDRELVRGRRRAHAPESDPRATADGAGRPGARVAQPGRRHRSKRATSGLGS